MRLNIPPEPKDVKEFIVRLRQSMQGGSRNNIDYDSQAVWYLNKLPKYLWEQWKGELVSMGYNWQRFLRIMKLHTNDVILWALQDKLSWRDLVSKIIDTLERYGRR